MMCMKRWSFLIKQPIHGSFSLSNLLQAQMAIGETTLGFVPAANAMLGIMAPMTGKLVAGYRLSTTKQGINGLGMAAQKQSVTNYLNGGNWKLLAAFTEVETGKKNSRHDLAEALALCRREKAVLLIAKLDRLAQNAC